MKYVNQKEYPDWLYITRTDLEGAACEKGKTTTVSSSGCGLCSAVMVADQLLIHSNFELKDAIRLAYDSRANHEIGTDYKIYAPAFAQKLGLKLEMTEDPERLRFCLRTGGAAVVHVGGDREGHIGVFSHGGHYIVAFAEEADGRIAVLDPSYVPGKYDEEGRAGKVELKDQHICLCDMQVLIDDTQNRTPHYYLFWRK